MNNVHDKIFNVSSNADFNRLAITIFKQQFIENSLYRAFVNSLHINPDNVTSVYQIPFLPVEFFKNHQVYCGVPLPDTIRFLSSGTTGMVQSLHLVKNILLYEMSFKKGFELFYGPVKDYTILALLPSYLEREGSSLIYMVNALIRESQQELSGYFLHNYEKLFQTLLSLQQAQKKVVLIGVTYALLDFIETHTLNFPELIVMETGGMKGKRKEMIREELHGILTAGFGVQHIHSEYGMTELLSQAYSKGDGLFNCAPWMKVLIRDINDPFCYQDTGKTGGLNIIDLANVNSCSFIATQDLGKIHHNGSFEVAGRFDNSDIRGCNLLVQ